MVRLEPAGSRRAVAGQLLWFLLWLGITAAALWLRPDPSGHGTHTQLGLPPCPSVLVMGRPCPGCGLTTSWTNVLHGNFAAAWSANPFGPFLYAGFSFSALLCLWGWFRQRRLDLTGRAFNNSALALMALFLTFATVRFFVTPVYPVTERFGSMAQSR